ncbi:MULTISPECIES: ABC transporter permease [Metallosphaera]|uniref:ABC transporter permease subunit n=1 Tax=Metallosphaera TaxID=41980 RepID=UPI001F06C3FD|nr:ABC transporter permease [Metallosphaera sedula]MCH1770238.1 ABC transporter permease [Metallosphaera sedula]MCP6727928.1 ABC transporter permease [Metallosphaera sedula]BBL47493.1 oligopeptide transport system permease protein OppB [Metallosphaera sedula]
MRARALVIISLILIIAGIYLSFLATESQYISLVSYGQGNCAVPPSNWQSQYWSVMNKGPPVATVILNGSKTLILRQVENVSLNSTSFYVYVIHGYVEELAPLSLPGILLVFVGSAMGFRGTVLLVQERAIGDLASSRGTGSLSGYVIKRFLSFLVSILIISVITAVLEMLHGENLFRVILELLTFNFGVSRHYGLDVDSLLISALPYTSLLSGISFSLSIYLGSFMAVRSVAQEGLLTKIVRRWKYIGNALASWIIALSLIYAFHLKVESGVNMVFPVIALFFPFIGTYANRLILPYGVNDAFKAKGLSRAVLVYRHMLGSASVVALSTISAAFVDMLVAEFLVESIFYWPGLGFLLREGAVYGDFKVVEGVLIFYSTIVLLSGLVGDIFYGYVDPRVRR